MTDIDLAAMRARLEIVEESRYGPLTIKQGRRADEALEELVTTDLPALLAEVERLRAAMERAFRDAVDTPADAESALGYALYGAEWESR